MRWPRVLRRSRDDRPDPEPRELPSALEPAPAAGIRRALFRTQPGRLLTVALLAKLLVWLYGRVAPLPGILDALDTAATLAAIVGLSYFLYRSAVGLKRRLLWRVRRKLILSYLFIGFVPVLLVVGFFLIGAVLMLLNLSSYLFMSEVENIGESVRAVAEAAAVEVGAADDPADAREILASRLAAASQRLPGISLVLAPTSAPLAAAGAPSIAPVAVGAWRHLDPPASLPGWLGRAGFSGLVAYTDGARTQVAIRAIGLPETAAPWFGVVADLPVDTETVARIDEATGIQLRGVAVVPIGGEDVQPMPGRAAADGTGAEGPVPRASSVMQFNWITFADYTDWASGQTGKIGMSTNVALAELWERISLPAGAQSRLGTVNVGDLLLLVLAIIAVLFLMIECFALIVGLALARSITGSVHELFGGTERVRQGDFSHRIRVTTRDQLGELAESFNTMTRSIEDLLRQAEEKKRLEEELRIARQIQMSLLPAGPLVMPGLSVAALCVPAREVGGDYYDFFRIGDRRLGLLIADVSGKGTSAALYMAELKGLMLSLSGIYDSPRELLIEVNRIISKNLDTRSFITMTYAILDLEARRLVYARAGHTPLIHLGRGETGVRAAEVLAPGGLVIGLQLDGIEEKFAELLVEHVLELVEGDVFVFFTDGITEAMNHESDLFGEGRLSELIAAHGALAIEELRERILREIEGFVGGAGQHDDMTMILIKVEALASGAARPAAPERVAV